MDRAIFPSSSPDLGTHLALAVGIALAAGRRISREVTGRRVSTIEGISMRKLISVTMMGVVAMGLGSGSPAARMRASTKTQDDDHDPVAARPR